MFINDVLALSQRIPSLKSKGINVTIEELEHFGNTLNTFGPTDMKNTMNKTVQVYITLDKGIDLIHLDGKVYHNGLELIAPTLNDFDVNDLLHGLDMTDIEKEFYIKHVMGD